MASLRPSENDDEDGDGAPFGEGRNNATATSGKGTAADAEGRRARDALRDVLAGGPVLATEARRQVMRRSGASDRTIDRAREGLVEAYQARGVQDARWYWRLAVASWRPGQEDDVGGSSAPKSPGRQSANASSGVVASADPWTM